MPPPNSSPARATRRLIRLAAFSSGALLLEILSLVVASPSSSVDVGAGQLGVRTSINSQVRTSDVRGLGACDERHQRRDFVHAAVPVERRNGLLRNRPFARGRIEFGVDRARLDVVDGDAAVSDLAR